MIYARVYGRGAVTLWFLTEDNKSPAACFLSELEVGARRKKVALLDATVERGPHRNVQKFRHLDGPIWEFKSGYARLFCFGVRGGYVITHGVKKAKDRVLRREIDRARRMMGEFYEEGGRFDG